MDIGVEVDAKLSYESHISTNVNTANQISDPAFCESPILYDSQSAESATRSFLKLLRVSRKYNTSLTPYWNKHLEQDYIRRVWAENGKPKSPENDVYQ